MQSREVGLTLGYLPEESGFGLVTDEHLQTVSRELSLALGDVAGSLDLDCTTGCLRRIV